MTTKMRGHSGKTITQKSRNSCFLNGRSCGCMGTVDSRCNFAQSQNQIQTLKKCLYCHMYCAQLWAHLGAIATAFCAVSNRHPCALRMSRHQPRLFRILHFHRESSILKTPFAILKFCPRSGRGRWPHTLKNPCFFDPMPKFEWTSSGALKN